ncbi:hypothetical protein [Halorussus amylolyticus]|uniref:hypothetical protein n=1 Tax=Halorussus amylolyticus TaxID=1126242 RepID=UPI0010488AB1|nr:hypothetical protein [Halorussus amylolyticus]
MGKVSIGLRGWRFDEDEIFTEDDDFRPMDDIPKDPRHRLLRLQALVGAPCDACWLIHGDENIHECNVAEAVYGEPLAEIVVCSDHESDFIYWFAEEGGSRYKGEDVLQDEFHEWFLDGGRAPEGYGGVEHVDTDPDDIPEPPEPDPEEFNVDVPDGDRERIDLRNMEVEGGEDGEDDEEATETEGVEGDLDLSQDYPTS